MRRRHAQWPAVAAVLNSLLAALPRRSYQRLLPGLTPVDLVFGEVLHEPGKTIHRFDGFEQITPGTQGALEYDDSVADLVAYLQWMAEPAQGTRVRIGVWVLVFLSILTVFVWRLNAAYWRSVK